MPTKKAVPLIVFSVKYSKPNAHMFPRYTFKLSCGSAAVTTAKEMSVLIKSYDELNMLPQIKSHDISVQIGQDGRNGGKAN